MTIHVATVSSLEKVFLEEEPKAKEIKSGSALRGERYSFQIVCHVEDAEKINISASVSTVPELDAQVYEVGVVPATFPVNSQYDEDYLRVVPGLFPDPLYPHEGDFSLAHDQWRSLWITTVIPENFDADSVLFTITLCDSENREKELSQVKFTLKVIPAVLPRLKLIHTEWFHLDCLASYYHVPVFSEEHWEIIENYMKNAADFGVNMILTPVLTPPLDTQVGGERPTVQLVDIFIDQNGRYRFGFEKLKRYIDLAEKCGIEYFEISHLFTQWGAAHAPKVVAETGNDLQKIFGWETDAASQEYVTFLNSFLKELRGWLTNIGKLDRCYFHISDEPDGSHLESYRTARNSVKDVLQNCKMIDALSDYEYYEKGIVQIPIPSIDHIEPFLAHDIPNL